MQDNVALKRKTEAWQRIINKLPTVTHTHTHPFNGPLSGTTRVSLYQKGKTSLDFTEPRYSEWRWHQLGHMQVCTSLQTDDHASTLPLSFFRPDALPATQPTASKHWRQKLTLSSFVQESIIEVCVEVRLTIGSFVLSLPTVLPLPVGYTGIGRVMSG